MRLNKLSDYAIVLLTHFARSPEPVHTARAMAARSRVPLPTVSKLVKRLARQRLLVAQRGAKGGYRLARLPEQIPLAEVLAAIEGPFALTQCYEVGGAPCALEKYCPTTHHWRAINHALADMLTTLTLADLLEPAARQHEDAP